MLYSGSCGCGRRIVISPVVLLLSIILGVFPNDSWAGNRRLEVVKDEYLIVPRAPGAAARALSAEPAKSAVGLRVVKNLGRSQLLRKGSTARALTIDSSEQQEREFVEWDPGDTTCKELLASGTVAMCEPNYKLSIDNTPNDPSLSSLWGLSADIGVDAMRAWNLTTGSTEVVVAIIDTGVDYNHPDLAANIWSNPGEIPGNGLDDDHNGYIDDIHGINTIRGSGNPMDDNQHGTHVAGTIGAVGNNGLGVSGINWNVRIMGLKFLNSSGSGGVSDAIEAIRYMVLMKNRGVNVRVCNNSWGGGGFSQSLFEAIKEANAAGIVFAAAAGNETNDNDATPSYPAGYDVANVVSVAAVDNEQNLGWFSNYGAESVDIAAPGVNILSTIPGSRYAALSGTSMATPHVSGSLALLAAADPSLDAAALIQRLYDSAVPLSSLNGVVRTGRLLNAARMVYNETAPLPTPTTPPPACDYSIREISQPADTSADHGEVVLNNVDEFEYTGVSLPFSFPYDGVEARRVTVSPNGVLYVGNGKPNGMDYQNGQTAPANSIAGLQADLVSTVRVSLADDRATFYWHSYSYSARSSGYADLRVTLFPDGRVEEWVAFSTPKIEEIVQAAATVGLAGRIPSKKLTYARNNSRIADGLALQYSPLCGAAEPQGPATVDNLKVWGVEPADGGRRRRTSVLTPGARFKVVVSASGSEPRPAQVAFALDNQLCAAQASISLGAGRTSFRGKVPRRLAGSVRRLKVELENAADSKPIADTLQGKPLKRRSLSSRGFSTLCNRIAVSFKQK